MSENTGQIDYKQAKREYSRRYHQEHREERNLRNRVRTKEKRKQEQYEWLQWLLDNVENWCAEITSQLDWILQHPESPTYKEDIRNCCKFLKFAYAMMNAKRKLLMSTPPQPYDFMEEYNYLNSHLIVLEFLTEDDPLFSSMT